MHENRNIEKIEKYIKDFSFPRLAGSEGEKKAVSLTFKTFESLGYNKEDIVLQPFKFSTFYSEVFIKIIIIMNIISISVLLLIKYLYPFFILILMGIILFIFISMNKVLKHPELKGFWEKNFGKVIPSTNVFTKISAKALPPDMAGDIIVSAHLDSKSQTYVTIWRVFFFRLWVYGEITLVILYQFFLLDYHEISTFFYPLIYYVELVIVIATILVIFSNISLLFLRIKNESPGALDNASGMAIVFELSSFFRERSLNNFNVWFCQFSAEEIGTMGSRNFIDIYAKEFNTEKTFQINFDMISAKNEKKKNRLEYLKSYGFFPRKKISPILCNLIEKSVRDLNLKIKKNHLLTGAHTDTVAFHLRKFDVVDFITKSAAKYSHSSRDTPDKVDPQILLETIEIVRLFLKMLDEKYQN